MCMGLVPNKKVLRLLAGLGRVTWMNTLETTSGPVICTFAHQHTPWMEGQDRQAFFWALEFHGVLQYSRCTSIVWFKHQNISNRNIVRCGAVLLHKKWHSKSSDIPWCSSKSHPGHCQDICQQLEHSTFEEVGLWGSQGDLSLMVAVVLRKNTMLRMLMNNFGPVPNSLRWHHFVP